MYFIITLVIITIGITNAQDCSKSIESVCESPFEISVIPDSVEEFKQLCMKVTSAVDCGRYYEEKCGKDPSTLELAYEVKSLVEEVCSDSTLLNAALTENFECLKRELFENENYVCDLPSEEELRRQAESLYSEMITDTLENEDPYKCLKQININACSAIFLEKQCGTIAMHAILEILRKAPLPCRDEFDLLPALIRIRKLENETGESLIKRKK